MSRIDYKRLSAVRWHLLDGTSDQLPKIARDDP
jgi:hypothetical protein